MVRWELVPFLIKDICDSPIKSFAVHRAAGGTEILGSNSSKWLELSSMILLVLKGIAPLGGGLLWEVGLYLHLCWCGTHWPGLWLPLLQDLLKGTGQAAASFKTWGLAHWLCCGLWLFTGGPPLLHLCHLLDEVVFSKQQVAWLVEEAENRWM